MEEKKDRSLNELKKTFVFVNNVTDEEKLIRAFSKKEAEEQLLEELSDKGTFTNWSLHGSQG